MASSSSISTDTTVNSSPFSSTSEDDSYLTTVSVQHYRERLYFVRIHYSQLPSSFRALLHAYSCAGDAEDVEPLQCWPALVYWDLDDFLGDLSPNEQKKILSDHETEPINFVARLLAWNHRDDGELGYVRLPHAIPFHEHHKLEQRFAHLLAQDDLGAIDTDTCSIHHHARRFLAAVEKASQLNEESITSGSIFYADSPSYDSNAATTEYRSRDVEGNGCAGKHSQITPTLLSSGYGKLDKKEDSVVANVLQTPPRVTKKKRKCEPALDTPPRDETKKKKKRKKARNRSGRNGRKTQSNAEEQEAGSRLVWNKSSVGSSARNDRTCMLDAIIDLIPSEIDKVEMYDAMILKMPKEGDTSVKCMNGVLEEYGLVLRSVTGKYNLGGGLEYHLLQERTCKLVIALKLTNLKKQTMSHCVAWDGKVIYDRPKNSVVSEIIDRRNQTASKRVFRKLYPDREFLCWQVIRVFSLDRIHNDE